MAHLKKKANRGMAREQVLNERNDVWMDGRMSRDAKKFTVLYSY